MSHYDANLINDRLMYFKNIVAKDGKQITILFDADNTLYKWSIKGKEQHSEQEMYTRFFYKNLPIFPEAVAVIENLQRLGIKCGIISAYIDSPWCRIEKEESFQYYFPMINRSDTYLVRPNTNKSELIKDIEHTILVDDYYVNINDWYNAGGIAIKKSYSGKVRPVPVVTSLIDLFSILHKLNIY